MPEEFAERTFHVTEPHTNGRGRYGVLLMTALFLVVIGFGAKNRYDAEKYGLVAVLAFLMVAVLGAGYVMSRDM